ncbi:MAG: RDD family protein [Rhodocyclaceae bacterium]|nr:MAG: RDD family protein [Rhodocyclaceae bacterium]
MVQSATTPAASLPGIRRRLASLLYECLLMLGVLSLTFMAPYLVLGVVFHVTPPGPVLLAHVFVVMGAYFLWYWRHGGQTLAMQTWKIQVQSLDRSAPTLNQAILRYCLAWAGILFYGAGLVWALFDRDRQFLHDRLAGTRIVFKTPSGDR